MAKKKRNTETNVVYPLQVRLRRALELLDKETPDDLDISAARSLVRWVARDLEELGQRIRAVTEPLPLPQAA
jgi:hypothetical protein